MKRSQRLGFAVWITLAIGLVLGSDSRALAADQPEAKTFKDVPANNWAYRSVQNMIDKGIVSGYSDGTFRPTEKLTREQFAKMLALTLDLDLVAVKEPTFSDIKANSWSLPYIETVKDYLQGYSFSIGKPFYDPGAIVTRQDVAVALVKGMKLKTDSANAEAIIRKSVSDYDAISPELAVYVAAAMENDLVAGFQDGTFKPNNGLDRASAVALMSRVIKSPALRPLKDIELVANLPDRSEKGKVRVEGTISQEAKLTVNGKPLQHSNGAFSQEISLDKGEGSYEFEFKAVKPNGRYKAVVKRLVYKIPGPAVSVEAPSRTDKQKIVVNGTVTDANDLKPTITVNGLPVSVSASGVWSKELEMKEGANPVTVVATNKSQKTTVIEKKVQFTVTAPALALNQIPDIVHAKSLTVTGKVTDLNDTNPKVTLNGSLVSMNGNISKTVELTEGDNQLQFEATNVLGKKTVVTKKVKYVILPPEISFDNFPEYSPIGEVTLRVSATDQNDPNPGIYLNDRYLGSRTVTTTLTLKEGENIYTVKAKNILGKQREVTKKIVYTISPPVLNIDPIPETTNAKTITVKASATDLNDRSPSLYLNDLYYGTGSFSRTVTLTEGDNTLTFKATNKHGKATTIVKKIKYVILPPVLTVNALPETVNAKTITIVASATDAADSYPKIYLNGQFAGSNTLSRTVNLTEGENVFEIKATNVYGKTSEVVVKRVNYVIPGPALTVGDIPESTAIGQLTITASATDPNDQAPKLFLNGTYVSYSSMSKTVTLAEGENRFEIKATNLAGKTSEVIVKKVVYTVPGPTLTIGGIPDIATEPTLTLSASVSDVADMRPKIYLNGVLQGESSFATSVTLAAGENTFVFKAVNASGKESVIVKKVVYTPAVPDPALTP